MGKAKFVEAEGDLSLVPIMNCVMCLIPAVLAGSAQVAIGVINVNAPKFGSSAAAPTEDNDNKPLNFTVAIGDDGFRLTASGDDIYEMLKMPPTEDGAGPLIPKKNDAYDFVELYSKLVMVKKAHTNESVLNLTAGAKIPFKYVTAVMDLARLQLTEDSYADLDQLHNADIKYESDNTTPVLLWPDVVFALAQ